MQLSGNFIPSGKFPWWFSCGKTPVPIPNTAVKTARRDNTWTVRSRKDSVPPRVHLTKASIRKGWGFCFIPYTHPYAAFVGNGCGAPED
jgi:hypothetical protein